MIVRFRVVGDFPPKKDGAQSMWGKPVEARRLEKLRRAAADALAGRGPLSRHIRLSVAIYVGHTNNRQTGDLDNFVTGICDGLMAADSRSKLDQVWDRPDLAEIHPSRTIGIVDDCEVIAIRAEKHVGQDSQPWYEVSLEGE